MAMNWKPVPNHHLYLQTVDVEMWHVNAIAVSARSPLAPETCEYSCIDVHLMT